ncbi:RagB/SusD family nutrient uptake outer membrane protein [Polaribacter sp. SA4-12]|uniref:RagB/SusD family nutrient uptake outer membrane protein n=1 Tax=Polaribacter sp. SA4-12 TaxID=1312072 RepID=UPI000B3C8AF2|nr:RagB/SusD family nutrient uptake outer membrane protein [Polaribacter sp. SA4-12]ARV15620.1 RagB/SusD family nutrient uptake outer membrane protein [Polaribacter sp. SA4-12]
MKKNKTIVKISLALLTFCMINIQCSEDVLNQSNPNALTPDSFWQTAEDAEKGIIGAYSPFSNILYYSRFEVFLSDYRDDVINGNGTSDRTQVSYFNTDPAGNPVKWVWQAMYQGVSRANEVLFRVPNIEMDQQQKDAILGEAHFLRAFNYFNLLNNWRNIPLLELPFSEIEDPLSIVQADPAQVWALIEADLIQAQSMLPNSWPADQKGRATSGAATGYLGKALLYQQKFGEAKTEFAKIIGSSYQLMDNYAHNFTEEFENNTESLFEIQLIADGNGGWGGDGPGKGKGSGYQPDFAPAGFTNQDGMEVNQWALDLFLDEKTTNNEIDPRAYTTLFFNTTETTTYEGNVLAPKTYGDQSYDEVYTAAGTKIYGNKYTDWAFNGLSQSLANGWHGAGNNLRMLRYADVLLMFAEADLMDDNNLSADGLEALNKVRRRVDMSEFTTATMQDIEDERVKELTFERTRYFDLLRWGKVVERIVNNPALKSNSAGTSAYKPGREYIAIPQNELDQNPNLKQNTGY